MTAATKILALDVGGTKLAAAIVTAGAPPRIEHAARCATPATAGPEDMWRAVTSLLDPLRAHPDGAGIEALGVGAGGPMTPGGESVSPLNIEAWRDFPLAGRLRERYGITVAVDNDAKALAAAEGRWGAAVGVRDYLAMVVSTGVGGGLVVDGRLLHGAAANAGHIGHVVVEPGGRDCRCGGRGCLEAETSGVAIEEITGVPAADAPPEVRRRTGMLVGRAVASVAALLDLRLALVAGSVALGFGDDFFAAAQAEADARARISFARGVVVRPCGLGADGPMLGAAAVGLGAIERGAPSLEPAPQRKGYLAS